MGFGKTAPKVGACGELGCGIDSCSRPSMTKTLIVDARWLDGGIGTYTKHLLAGVCDSRNGFEVQAITRKQYAKQVNQWCPRVTIIDASMYTLREQLAIPRAAAGCDLLHVPHYNAPLLHRGPLLVSI